MFANFDLLGSPATVSLLSFPIGNDVLTSLFSPAVSLYSVFIQSLPLSSVCFVFLSISESLISSKFVFFPVILFFSLNCDHHVFG